MAIARDVPSSFTNAVTKFAAISNSSKNQEKNEEEESLINVANTKLQKDEYLKALRKYVPTLCLPALDSQPDSIFVEDTVVAIGHTAVITNPGHVSRRGEVDTIRDVFQQLGYTKIVDMREENGAIETSSSKNIQSSLSNDVALCDGGDVLYTGRHLFVGLSERTNAKAVDVLKQTFSDIDVVAVPFEGAALHLKSIVTHMDETTLLAPLGPLGDQVLQNMEAEKLGYSEIFRLPSMLACNIVAVNGGILAQHTGCEESKTKLSEAAKNRNLDIVFVDMSEIAKADGALTCCSVLLQI